ncbi:hypothetical protein [Methylosinus sp. KRF6]|uniref:hypothetical protein n=1 Tax=Methylosinus sp. KRF6 TaxID=2846853 RepID=UPI001C0AA3DB|nr:hypothetical protein [Methylosinus sp. KRF6]MBU3887201.1 hypothetical protein [Methylosinus sp. KRF6]
MRLLVTYDASALQTLISGLDEAGQGKIRTNIAGAINKVGGHVHDALIEPLKIQTGLKGSTIPRALHDSPAGENGLAYQIVARGGDINLKYFGAREDGDGVTAFPRGVRTHFAGAFIKSGRKPNRQPSPKLNGQVYTRISGGKNISMNGKPKWKGSWGGQIKKQKSGVFIPEEMVRGESLRAFNRIVNKELPSEMSGILTMMIGGRKLSE